MGVLDARRGEPTAMRRAGRRAGWRAGVRWMGAGVLAALIALAGCRRTPSGGGPAPADRRAILLHPEHAFWRTRAPDTVRTRFETSKGVFVVETYRAWAPRGVDRFYNLARSGFFDDSRFFRVVPDFVAQFGIAGDPAVATVWRDAPIPDDPHRERNVRGTIAFAMRRPDDRRTQLYINLRDNPRIDPDGFAVLGRVVEGMDVVDRLHAGYGERAGGGVRAGRQERLFAEGNAYLDANFPQLDRLMRATVAAGNR